LGHLRLSGVSVCLATSDIDGQDCRHGFVEDDAVFADSHPEACAALQPPNISAPFDHVAVERDLDCNPSLGRKSIELLGRGGGENDRFHGRYYRSGGREVNIVLR
jgi:hypothetical protein